MPWHICTQVQIWTYYSSLEIFIHSYRLYTSNPSVTSWSLFCSRYVSLPPRSLPLSDRVFIRKASAFMSCITCSGRQVKDFCREMPTNLRLQVVSILYWLKSVGLQYGRKTDKKVNASRMTKCNNYLILKFTEILRKNFPWYGSSKLLTTQEITPLCLLFI